MKKVKLSILLVLVLVMCAIFASACGKKVQQFPEQLDYNDKDLAGANAATLEAEANYKTRYKNGSINIGDVMPYYENGVYHFFYLAEGGSNAGHPVFRADTTDFVNFTDKSMVLSPGASTSQDSMIGTGSVEKVGNEYYFFYTGFLKGSPEAVMLAKSTTLDNFSKVDDFYIYADPTLDGWDFRDPEAVFDGEKIHLFISARKGGVPVIVRYTVSTDLSQVSYEGVVFSDNRFGANVLECADVFKIDDKWYMTYSIQDVSNGGADGSNAANASVGSNGKMFYAVSPSLQGKYEIIAQDNSLDSISFYAAKTAQDETNTYLAGWVRQKGSNAGWQYTWGGNLQVHQLTANADGTLNVAMPQSLRNYYSVSRQLDQSLSEYNGLDLIAENKNYHTISSEYPSYLLNTTVRFDEQVKEFGFALAVTSNTANIMEVTIAPQANKLRSGLNSKQEIAFKDIKLSANRDYNLTLLVEGSSVTLYINNSVAFTSRIRNIGNKTLSVFAKDGSVNFKDFSLFTPSDYADTLNVDSKTLTVNQNGEATGGGNVTCVAINPQSSAEIKYKSPSDNYIRYTLAAKAEKDCTVTIMRGGEQIASENLTAGNVEQIIGDTYAYKDQEIIISISCIEQSNVLLNASFETDKRAFNTSIKASSYSVSGSASYMAGTAGVYGYTATVSYGGDLSAKASFNTNNGSIKIASNNRLYTLRGAVQLAEGQKLTAGMLFDNVLMGESKIALKVYSANSQFEAGIGNHTSPKADACILSNTSVPTFSGDFTLEQNRGMNVTMNSDNFGVQGKSGFIYAYGKASNELFPMTEYNTNGEAWEYRHRAPEVNDALEIKADYMKQGGGYVTAVVWIAPSDGNIGLSAGYTSFGEGYSQVQVYINRTLLFDKFLSAEDNIASVAIGSIPVVEGDAVIFAVRSAGITSTEGDGNYSLSIFEGVDLNAPVVANYKNDYNTDRQGDYGWRYAKAVYSWAPERPTALNDLAKSNSGWEGDGVIFTKDGKIKGNEAALVYKNTTGSTISINLRGKINVITPSDSTVAVRIWIVRSDNSTEKIKEGFFGSEFEFTSNGVRLGVEDSVAVIFFDNAVGCEVDLTVASSDQFDIDKTALDNTLLAAKAIDNKDNRYTPESFAVLTAAITTADNRYSSLESYADISMEVLSLQTAIKSLAVNIAAAKVDLLQAINSASIFDNKTLIGGRETLDNAVTAAQSSYDNASATIMEITQATSVLNNIVASTTIKVADLVDDFSDKQGSNGWTYLSAKISFADGFHITSTTRLPYDSQSQSYKSGDVLKLGTTSMRSDEAAENYAAVGYRNYTKTPHSYVFKGEACYLGSDEKGVFAFVVLKADGTQKETKGDWNEYNATNSLKIDVRVTLDAGETFVLLLRDVDKRDSESALSLEVGCNDELMADKTELSAAIDRYKLLSSDEFTTDTFNALQAKITAAEAVVANPNATAAEIILAISELDIAASELVSLVANFYDDFNGSQGIKGWYYNKTEFKFDGIDKPHTPTLLTYQDNVFKNPDNSINIGKEEIFGAFAQIAWQNITGKAQTFTFSGDITKLGEGNEAALGFYIINKSTAEEHLHATTDDAKSLQTWFGFNKDNVGKFTFKHELKVGERFVIVLRDAGGAATNCKLNLQISCNFTI